MANSHVQHVHEVREREEPAVGPSVFIARLVFFIFGIIIAFIALRFVLLMLGANEGNAFVDLVYGISGIFVAPFYGMFNNTPQFGASVIDVSSVVAIIVYALIAWAISSLLTLGSRERSEV
jgi:uncharacterized protein YggT (Ycf19 family)